MLWRLGDAHPSTLGFVLLVSSLSAIEIARMLADTGGRMQLVHLTSRNNRRRRTRWEEFARHSVHELRAQLATQAEGRTLVHDWLYELRLFALEQLSAMHADLFLCDSHRMIVTGPTKLRGRRLDSRDIRSGMALIAAALSADGESVIAPIETVERGYGSLVERLTMLGAQVERIAGDAQ